MQADDWRMVKDHTKTLVDVRTEVCPDDQTFSEWVGKLLKTHGLVKSEVVRNSFLNPTYAYQIMSGCRHGTRNKLLQLAFGARLSIESTNELLERGGSNPLRPNCWRDVAIAYCLDRKMSVPTCDSVLTRAGLEPLRKNRH